MRFEEAKGSGHRAQGSGHRDEGTKAFMTLKLVFKTSAKICVFHLRKSARNFFS